MVRMQPAQIRHARLIGATVAISLTASAPADARDINFVPEIDTFVRMSETTRLYFEGQVTTAQSSGVSQTELGAHVDVTLSPILRRSLREDDWERDRYLWTRFGYEIFGSPDNEGRGPTEKRVIAEMTGQAPLSLTSDIWLTSRLRVDFRDIGGALSKRYRYRLGIQQEITLSNGKSLVPYIQCEILYDTRYDSWNRRIYQAGVEIKMTHRWRIEPYYSRQFDSRSASSNVDKFGLQVKLYW